MKRKYLKNKTFWLGAAAIVLAGSVSAQSAMAYFTTYVKAKGGYEITLGSQTEIEEDVKDMTKEIKISNTGETDCYVRVKVFAGSQYQEGLVYSDESGKWTPGDDGYYYYSDIIAPGAKSEELLVKISNMNLPKDFNVIVVSECTPVILDAEGNPSADWTKKADVAQTEEVGE